MLAQPRDFAIYIYSPEAFTHLPETIHEMVGPFRTMWHLQKTQGIGHLQKTQG